MPVIAHAQHDSSPPHGKARAASSALRTSWDVRLVSPLGSPLFEPLKEVAVLVSVFNHPIPRAPHGELVIAVRQLHQDRLAVRFAIELKPELGARFVRVCSRLFDGLKPIARFLFA